MLRLKIVYRADPGICTIVDQSGDSIVELRSIQSDNGDFITMPVFRREVAEDLVLAINLINTMRAAVAPKERQNG